MHSSNAPGYNFDPSLGGFDNPEASSFNCLGDEEAADGGLDGFVAKMPDYCANPHPERLSPEERLDCGYRPSLSPDEKRAREEWEAAKAAQAAGVHAAAGGPDTVSAFYPNQRVTSQGQMAPQQNYKKWILVAVALGIGAFGLYKIYRKYNLGSWFGGESNDDAPMSNPPSPRARRRQATRLRERLKALRPKRNPARQPKRPKCAHPGCRGRALDSGNCKKHEGMQSGDTDYVADLKQKVDDDYEEDPTNMIMANLETSAGGMSIAKIAELLDESIDDTKTLVEALEAKGMVTLDRIKTNHGIRYWVKAK